MPLKTSMYTGKNRKQMNNMNTPIVALGKYRNNNLYIKRDDLIPYSFGGNKARKGQLFFEEIDKSDYTHVVTYGSSHSNHCRIVANMAAGRKLTCIIISPDEVSDDTYNSAFMKLFNAQMIVVPTAEVSKTIDNTLENIRIQGGKPFFIPGGGHGNLGTEAYVRCYEEICAYEASENTHMDYIFFASGTGTTQAGLVCGQIMHKDSRKIVGISIARKNPRGRNVVLSSIKEYLGNVSDDEIDEKAIFVDDYTEDGYGKQNQEIMCLIKDIMIRYGIPLDSTYTGKAFLGMQKYIESNNISGNNILFIHTGGTPLFFDDMKKLK